MPLREALVLFGWIGYTKLPVRELPDIDFPIVSVVTTLPGADPEVVEKEVTEILEEDLATKKRELKFRPGPVFTNILLADEINRTPPKTQAALLEAMQEKSMAQIIQVRSSRRSCSKAESSASASVTPAE